MGSYDLQNQFEANSCLPRIVTNANFEVNQAGGRLDAAEQTMDVTERRG
jgi:hypothetical protein